VANAKRSYRLSSGIQLIGILALLFVVDGLSFQFTARFIDRRALENAWVILKRTAISPEERVKKAIDSTLPSICLSRADALSATGAMVSSVSSPATWSR
jgi:hypothetical protein